MPQIYELTTEDKKWITKATQSVSLKPLYGLIEQLKKSGFREVKIAYPEIFQANRFNKFDRFTKLQLSFSKFI